MTRYSCPLTVDGLREYSIEHLWYEVRMFFEVGVGLPSAIGSPAIDYIWDALLESFAIHLRNLLDFFYNESPWTDDVIAAAYYDSGRLPTGFPQPSPLLKDAGIRASKWVSHLTTRRLPGGHPDKEWDLDPLMDETTRIVLAFADTAPPDRLDPEFARRVRELINWAKRQLRP